MSSLIPLAGHTAEPDKLSRYIEDNLKPKKSNPIVEQHLKDGLADIRLAEQLLDRGIHVEEAYRKAIDALGTFPSAEDYFTLRKRQKAETSAIINELEKYNYRELATNVLDLAIRLKDVRYERERFVEKVVLKPDLARRARLALALYNADVVIPEFFEQVAGELESIPEISSVFKSYTATNNWAGAADLRRQLQVVDRDLKMVRELRTKLVNASLAYRQKDAFERTSLTHMEMAVDAAEGGLLPDSYGVRDDIAAAIRARQEAYELDQLPYMFSEHMLDNMILTNRVKLSRSDKLGEAVKLLVTNAVHRSDVKIERKRVYKREPDSPDCALRAEACRNTANSIPGIRLFFEKNSKAADALDSIQTHFAVGYGLSTPSGAAGEVEARFTPAITLPGELEARLHDIILTNAVTSGRHEALTTTVSKVEAVAAFRTNLVSSWKYTFRPRGKKSRVHGGVKPEVWVNPTSTKKSIGTDIELNRMDSLRTALEEVVRSCGSDIQIGPKVVWIDHPVVSRKNKVLRVYRLRRGVQHHAADWAASADKERFAKVGNKATVLSSAPNYIAGIITSIVTNAEARFDMNSHTLFVRAPEKDLPLVERLIHNLDVTPPQVLIEARFIEVAVSDLRDVGLEWTLDGALVTSRKTVSSDGGAARVPETQILPTGEGNPIVSHADFTESTPSEFPFSPRGPGASPLSVDTDGRGLNLTVQGVLSRPRFEAVLHAIELSGKGRSLSAPRVTTVNNNPAKLRHGEDFHYFNKFDVNITESVRDDASNDTRFLRQLTPAGSALDEETGITLTAVPSVGSDGRTISLLLNPVISRLEKFVSYQETADTNDFIGAESEVTFKLPVFSRREIQTKVVVRSGETVVMGGLIDSEIQEVDNRIPVIGQIPLIGGLFRSTEETEKRLNLLIFVTATVISEQGKSLVPLEGPGLPWGAKTPRKRN